MVTLSGLDRGAVLPRLERAIERLRPRGPDGEGAWSDHNCALGHTRLAVIDLSQRAAQPMCRHGMVIAYNGEIYNYLDLRVELEALGYHFESRSDTEVLLAGWREWQDGLLSRLNGMFAFALWDPGSRALVLARDRFGKKPLIYTEAGGSLLFASELVSLTRLAGASFDIDRQSLRLLFSLRYIPEPRSIAAGVAKLAAGHWARFDSRGLHIERWTAPLVADEPPYDDFTQAAEALRERVDRAVAARLVSDVPVGAFLSGGVDSAVIASAMVATGVRVRTFTVGFPGAGLLDERDDARRVARHLGTEHEEIEIPPSGVGDSFHAAVMGFDEPFGDPSGVPTYLLSQAVRRKVTVALSGDGGDEVFGGYRKYVGELLARRYGWLAAGPAGRLLTSVISPAVGNNGSRAGEVLRKLRRFAAYAHEDTVGRQAGWARLLSEAELDELLGPGSDGPPVEALFAELGLGGAQRGRDPINTLLLADQAFSLASQMLVKVDRMSMAASLEVRSPFLDTDVVACANAMPGDFKVSGGRGKRVLERAFADRLPAEVFTRPKRGFDPPIREWLTGELSERVRHAVDPFRLERQGLFARDMPARWLDNLLERRGKPAAALWTFVAFQAWWDNYFQHS